MDKNDQTSTPANDSGKLPANPDGNLPIDLVGDDAKDKKEATKESEQGAQKGQTEELKSGAEAAAPTQPTFTQDELDERIKTTKGGYEGTIQKLKGDIKQAQEAMSNLALQREEESFSGFLKSVEDQGGDTKAAEAVVARQRDVSKRERDTSTREAIISEQMSELNVAGRAKKAYDLAKEHKLDDKAVSELLAEETPEKMEIKALRLVIEGKQVDERQPAKPDSSVGSTQGLDESKLTPEQSLGRAIDNIERRR